MKKNKAIKLGLVTLFSSMALGTAVVYSTSIVDAAPLGTPLQLTLYEPNPAPTKFLNVWMTNGYALQPDSVTNAKINDKTKVLHTDAVRSLSSIMTGALDAPHYRWYKSENGRNWSAVPENEYGHRANMPINANEEGTTWYQLDTQYYNYATGWLAKTHIYSNIAQVNVLTDDVNPESVQVSTDTNYVYNTNDKLMNVAYAHADVQPANATGKLTWSIDRPDIATIDSTTGKITANSTGANGRVKVTATFTGSEDNNPKVVVGSSYVTVGGGLNNPTINVGQTATFNLQGNQDDFYGYWDENDLWVEWYTKEVGQKDSKQKSLGTTKGLSYTTPVQTETSSNKLYKAKVIMRKGSKKTTLTTNWASLTVR